MRFNRRFRSIPFLAGDGGCGRDALPLPPLFIFFSPGSGACTPGQTHAGTHLQTHIIYELGFNQNYYKITFNITVKIVMCSKFAGTEFVNYKCFDMRFPGSPGSNDAPLLPLFLQRGKARSIDLTKTKHCRQVKRGDET